MDVTAYPLAGGPTVPLGAIAQSIWANGFKRSSQRTVQVSKPINAPAPNLFDRLLVLESFQFAAGQSFADAGGALIQLATFPATVPTLCNLLFTQDGQTTWLGNCGITEVTLVEKRGALVIFSFTITGGTWSKNKPS